MNTDIRERNTSALLKGWNTPNVNQAGKQKPVHQGLVWAIMEFDQSCEYEELLRLWAEKKQSQWVVEDVRKAHGCMRCTGNIKEEGLERIQRQTGREKGCKMHSLGRMHSALAIMTLQQLWYLCCVYTKMDSKRGSEAPIPSYWTICIW